LPERHGCGVMACSKSYPFLFLRPFFSVPFKLATGTDVTSVIAYTPKFSNSKSKSCRSNLRPTEKCGCMSCTSNSGVRARTRARV
jgi:hypothetical protein